MSRRIAFIVSVVAPDNLTKKEVAEFVRMNLSAAPGYYEYGRDPRADIKLKGVKPHPDPKNYATAVKKPKTSRSIHFTTKQTGERVKVRPGQSSYCGERKSMLSVTTQQRVVTCGHCITKMKEAGIWK